ncbi:putative fungal specific transcription factor domain-containing protein [Ilyonectria robusta]
MWKLHGDTVSLLTFLGLHACAPDGPKYVPTICSEWKRRVCAFVFIVDKLLASFTGRPPALSRRYMLTPLPLDLDNDVLLGDKVSLSQAMQQLNATGWNKNGVMTSSTIYRARTAIAFLKDELLEIAMGHGLERTVETLL